MKPSPGIYIFNGENARLPSGAFSELARAEEWIAAHRLSGLLTWYPLDAGVYDYAVANNLFAPKKPHHTEPSFIGSFTTAYVEHHHYVDGVREGG